MRARGSIKTMRILIVKLSSIGDVVHTLPAAALIRRALPRANVIWVVDRRASAILKGSPVIDELIELDTKAWRKDFLTGSTLNELRTRMNQLRKGAELNGGESSDVAIDFQGLIKSGVVALASRATRRIGFETGELRERASKLFLTEQVETAAFRHVIQKNLLLARAAIANSAGHPNVKEVVLNGDYEFPIAISAEDESFVDGAIGKQQSRFVIVNPGGGWSTKLWSPDMYAQLADWLCSDCGLASFVTYGPGEEDLAQAVASKVRGATARPLATTLKQFVALARRAALFVGGDTGPLHLAAAAGTPIVGLYGPTSPERNGPFDPKDIAVGRDLWCRTDCHRRSCWHWECMDIPLDDVKRAISLRLESAIKKKAD
jgi:lipopolysaccharide heptosyltransferase I